MPRKCAIEGRLVSEWASLFGTIKNVSPRRFVHFSVTPRLVQQVGVHIADVTHFMRPGTALDDEAINRATSVYLSDKVRSLCGRIWFLNPRVINLKFPLRPHQKYRITQCGELGFSELAQIKDYYTTNSHYLTYAIIFKRLGDCTVLFELGRKGVKAGFSKPD